MNRTPVSSSSIASVGHDPATGALEIEFKNGGVYVSDGPVSAEEHANLLGAASIGKHFQEHFRKPGRKFKKVA